MSVAVDSLSMQGFMLNGRHVPSCHLLADSADELHALAERIGCRRAWCHGVGRKLHYDLTARMRAKAIQAGAIILDRKGLGLFLRSAFSLRRAMDVAEDRGPLVPEWPESAVERKEKP